jgi:DNA polymerase I
MSNKSRPQESRQQSLFESEPSVQAPIAPGHEIVDALKNDSMLSQQNEGSVKGKAIYALDISLLMFQYFHAIDQMASPRGQPTNCVFGLMRDLFHLLDDRKADGILAAVDLPGKTFRDDLYPSYKEKRTETPAELIEQIPFVERLLKSLQIPVLGLPGFEADDVLASVARQIEEEGGTCYLVTLDKDCRQLLSDHVRIYDIRKQQEMGELELHAAWGIRPDQVVDFQSLVGDAVDNVPGVPLIGPKIASQLLGEYQTLDGIYEHLHEMPSGKRKQNLEACRNSVLLSRQLVELRKDLPLPWSWDKMLPSIEDFAATSELTSELGFRKFTEMLRSRGGKLTLTQPRVATDVMDTPDRMESLLHALQGVERIALRLVTDHPRARWAKPLGFALAWDNGACFVPAPSAGSEERLSLDWRAPLRAITGGNPVKLVGYDLKYDLIVLRSIGFPLLHADFDPLLAAFVLDAGSRDLALVAIARKFASPDFSVDDALLQQDVRSPASQGMLLPADAAVEQARTALHLRETMLGRLENTALLELLNQLEIPLVPVLAEMEFHGVRVDPNRLKHLSELLSNRIERLEKEIHAAAGHPFNIASPKQLATVLFDELKLPGVKKTKSGQSTDMEVLEKLAEIHPLPAKIIEYRHFAKLKGTYVDALPELIHPVTQRIHTAYSQVAASTGRLSSAEPNLQNIPIRSDIGNEIRSAFIAEQASSPTPELATDPDANGCNWLLAADYSQIELRVLAHFSQDASLLEAFAKNEDIHTRVAAEIHRVDTEAVTSSMRRVAKTVNFGVIYGQSAFGLAKSLKIETDVAARFIDAYFAKYPGIVRFMDEILDACLRDGFVQTLAGRRRPVDGVRPPHARSIHQRNLSERTAINSVIQGSAADLMKKAMINVHNRLQEADLAAKLLLQIHDELLLEVPSSELDQVAELLKTEMEAAYPLSVPLHVDVEYGTNWANCKKWEPPA